MSCSIERSLCKPYFSHSRCTKGGVTMWFWYVPDRLRVTIACEHKGQRRQPRASSGGSTSAIRFFFFVEQNKCNTGMPRRQGNLDLTRAFVCKRWREAKTLLTMIRYRVELDSHAYRFRWRTERHVMLQHSEKQKPNKQTNKHWILWWHVAIA